MSAALQILRRTEIGDLRRLFTPGISVLEIGGGNGFQASLIASYGAYVTSIDITSQNKHKVTYYSVQKYDGKNIPFPDCHFDIVFSSNVLEHVKDLPYLLGEMRRVMKRTGHSVHIVPTSCWRLWTSIAHYPYLVKYLADRIIGITESQEQPMVSNFIAKHGKWRTFIRILSAGPHGEHSNALSELYYFSKSRWTNIFTKNGFVLNFVDDNGLFYTGYGLIPGLKIKTRRRIARFLGSACHIFLLAK